MQVGNKQIETMVTKFESDLQLDTVDLADDDSDLVSYNQDFLFIRYINKMSFPLLLIPSSLLASEVENWHNLGEPKIPSKRNYRGTHSILNPQVSYVVLLYTYTIYVTYIYTILVRQIKKKV